MWKRIQALRENIAGTVLAHTAITLPVLLGFGGLSVDVAYWYGVKRETQAIADAAAMAGALERTRTQSSSGVVAAAERDAVANGYDAAAGDVLTLHHPPLSGPVQGAGNAVAAIVERPASVFLAALFLGDETVTVTARAVAVAENNDTCVYALNPTASGAIKVSGGAQVELYCGLVANSSDPAALTQSGTGCLTATNAKVVGGYSGSCIQPPPVTGARPVKDPLAQLQPPVYGACDYPAKITVNAGQTVTLSPATYCGGLNVQSGGTLYLNPGLYIMKNASITFSSSAIVRGSGVTFYLSPNSTNGGSISIAAGADVELSAPTTGTYAGVLFFHDRTSPTNISHSLTGGSSMLLDGILYFPKQTLNFSGGSTTDNSSSILIADMVSFSGNASLGDLDGTPAAANPLLVSAALVE